MALIYAALNELTRHDIVDTGILHSVLAVWVWVAILRRELNCFLRRERGIYVY